MLRDALGQEHARAGAGARIVSLVPSITELLFALELGGQVVGRTGFCIHPREAVRAVPKLGGTKDIDFAGLERLAPTHVIVNIDENTRPDFERLREIVPHVVVTHPNAPEDNPPLYRLLGGMFGRETEAEALAADFDRALAALRARTDGLPPRRVVYLIWREPWMAVSADTYIARMLALVNWRVAALASDARYPEIDAAELAAPDLDLVLLSSEPYPFRDRHLAELRTLTGTRSRVELVDGEMLSWYGSRAIAGLDYLGRLAGELAAAA
ncbi:MAG: helical backbone metal receptor [Gammaproteobacteria bacterium]